MTTTLAAPAHIMDGLRLPDYRECHGRTPERPRSGLMSESEVTIGEIGRRVQDLDRLLGQRMDGLERTMGQGFTRIDRTLDSLQFVHRETYSAERSAMQADLAELKDKMKWISRTVAGSMITAVMAAIVAIAARGGV